MPILSLNRVIIEIRFDHLKSKYTIKKEAGSLQQRPISRLACKIFVLDVVFPFLSLFGLKTPMPQIFLHLNNRIHQSK